MTPSTANLHSRSFSERLQSVLSQRGLTQKELSERIFINPSTVTRWITGGSTPQPRTVEAIANAIGVRKEWLLTGDGERDAPGGSSRSSMVVKEDGVDYETVKHVIFIEEAGTPEQIAAARAFLKTLRDQIAHTADRSGDR
jgi:transcriptional regulator with XRE-family HTH domain